MTTPRISKEDAIQTLDYWIGIAECNCLSTLPTGGCIKCDLERISQYIVDTEGKDVAND